MSQAGFYDQVAPRYDDLVTAAPIDQWIRRAFQHLVRERIPPGSLLLDFGCGTGLDALWYAQQGYRVLAYDVSDGMLEQLRRRCAAEIARGAIIPIAAPFADCSGALSPYPVPAAIVSNYGVLNAFPQPRQFFAATAPFLACGAPVIVSVLNGFFWRDMLRRWWWAALLRSGRIGAILSRGEGIDTYRHFVSSLRRAAQPAFNLHERASVGAIIGRRDRPLDWDAPRGVAERFERRWWQRWPLNAAGLFLFLVFRRT